MIIWKYKLDITMTQEIEMPRSAEILSAASQGDDICIWARVNPGNPTDERTLLVFPTGETDAECPIRRFIDTVMIKGLVFHVYEGN